MLWNSADTYRDEVSGWLSVPWRDPRHAIRLMLDWYKTLVGRTPPNAAEERVVDFLHVIDKVSWHEDPNGTLYWTARDLSDEMRAGVGTGALCLFEILEALQRTLANSDGGGAVCNHHVLRVYELVTRQTDLSAKSSMLQRRLDDAVPDHRDHRRRKAFTVAWERGLYRLAYLV